MSMIVLGLLNWKLLIGAMRAFAVVVVLIHGPAPAACTSTTSVYLS